MDFEKSNEDKLDFGRVLDEVIHQDFGVESEIHRSYLIYCMYYII